jgi:hypothetical protein
MQRGITDLLDALQERVTRLAQLDGERERTRQEIEDLRREITEHGRAPPIPVWSPARVQEYLPLLGPKARQVLGVLRRASSRLRTSELADLVGVNDGRALGPVFREVRTRAEQLNLPDPILQERFGKDTFHSLAPQVAGVWPLEWEDEAREQAQREAAARSVDEFVRSPPIKEHPDDDDLEDLPPGYRPDLRKFLK